MLRNYFNTILRNLAKSRTLTAINISGLALGMAIAFIIGVYIRQETSYDKFHHQPDLLYRVAKADSLGRNAPWVSRDKWYDADAQEWFIHRARELDVAQAPPNPILLGRHLIEMGVAPGPEMGEITRAVYEMQLDGRVRTLEEAQAEAKKLISH